MSGDIFQITLSRATDILPFVNYFSKMRFTTTAVALAFTLFSVSGGAAPTPASAYGSTATIQLANDQSGANINVAVPVDGVTRFVEELWGRTSIAQNGLVFASTAQLIAFSQTVVCTFTYDNPSLSATLNAETTWVSFGGGRVVDLCSAQVVCKCDGM